MQLWRSAMRGHRSHYVAVLQRGFYSDLQSHRNWDLIWLQTLLQPKYCSRITWRGPQFETMLTSHNKWFDHHLPTLWLCHTSFFSFHVRKEFKKSMMSGVMIKKSVLFYHFKLLIWRKEVLWYTPPHILQYSKQHLIISCFLTIGIPINRYDNGKSVTSCDSLLSCHFEYSSSLSTVLEKKRKAIF